MDRSDGVRGNQITSMLTILDFAGLGDTGDYTCIVINIYGADYYSLEVAEASKYNLKMSALVNLT